MNGKCLLDTNIVIALFKGEPKVLKELARCKTYVPAIVIGELRYGAEKSERSDSNHTQIDALINEVIVLPITRGKYYGEIKNQLRSSGKRIPENDIWIAAISMENDIALFTRDKHFANINDLKTKSWDI